MRKKSIKVAAVSTPSAPSAIGTSYPLPEATATALTGNNEFLAKFITNVYGYKQKQELRVNRLNFICYVIQYTSPEEMIAKLKLIAEMSKSGETIVLADVSWETSETEIKSGRFQEVFVNKIHAQYHNIMRHGLATVIRTAQKKEADIIL